MPTIVETIPDALAAQAEAARAWFANARGAEFELTGIVDPDAVPDAATRELQLILCGEEDGQPVCLRERFRVSAVRGGFDVAHVDAPAPALGSPAPHLDPPTGMRAGWLDEVVAKHAFVVLLFYRGFW